MMHTMIFFLPFVGSFDSVNLCRSIDTMLEELEELVSSQNQFCM